MRKHDPSTWTAGRSGGGRRTRGFPRGDQARGAGSGLPGRGAHRGHGLQCQPALGAPAARPPATAHAAEERLAAESALRDAVADALGDQSDTVELRTVTGQAGRNLVNVARQVNAQLLVLAERSGAATLLGAVSQYVLRKAPCPVLVVPEAGQQAGQEMPSS